MTDIETAIMIKNMARETVRQMSAKNAGEVVEMNGKKYRCTREPRGESDFGSWEFLHNGSWHEVLNYQIRADLNRKAGYWGTTRHGNSIAKNAGQFKRGDKVTVDGKYDGVVQAEKDGYYEVRIFDGYHVVGDKVCWPKDLQARK